MLDNNPFSGFINAWSTASSNALQWVSDRLGDLANFVGIAAKPATTGIQPSFTPPFTGGQCVGSTYTVSVNYTRIITGIPSLSGTYTDTFPAIGAINSIAPFRVVLPPPSVDRINLGLTIVDTSGSRSRNFGDVSNVAATSTIAINSITITRSGGVPDNCGNVPNPNPPLPSDYGALASANPDGGTSGQLVSAGLPVLTASGILAALRAIAAGIAAISDVLAGIQQIGEAIKKIADLLKEIFDGKKDDDKEKPKYRRYAVGQWYSLNSIDGFIPTTPISIGGVQGEPYKLQIVVQAFPSTSSRVLGTSSPSISIDTLPLFYLLLQEDDYGITAVKSIRTLNSSTSIPPFHRGIFWNFRLNPSIVAKYRLFYQTEQIEQELPLLP